VNRFSSSGFDNPHNNREGREVKPAEKNQIARINRHLRKDFYEVRTARGQRQELELGRFYLINTYRNAICEYNVDLDDLERQIRDDQAVERRRKLEEATAKLLQQAQASASQGQ